MKPPMKSPVNGLHLLLMLIVLFCAIHPYYDHMRLNKPRPTAVTTR